MEIKLTNISDIIKMEKDKNQSGLEEVVKKNRPTLNVVKIVAGVGLGIVSTHFDYGVVDNILTISGGALAGLGISNFIRYAVAKSNLRDLEDCKKFKCSKIKEYPTQNSK